MSVGQHTYDNTGRRRHDIEAFTGNTGVWVWLVQTEKDQNEIQKDAMAPSGKQT